MVKWVPQSSKFIKGYLVYPLAVIFILSNLFVLVMYLFPAQRQNQGLASSPLVSSYVGPVISMAVYGGAILYWLWDQRILPSFGYRFDVREEDAISGEDDVDVKLTFMVCRAQRAILQLWEERTNNFTATTHSSCQKYCRRHKHYWLLSLARLGVWIHEAAESVNLKLANVLLHNVSTA